MQKIMDLKKLKCQKENSYIRYSCDPTKVWQEHDSERPSDEIHLHTNMNGIFIHSISGLMRLF